MPPLRPPSRPDASTPDGPTPDAPPSEQYRQRQQAREGQAAHFDRIHRRLGDLRLALVLATLALAWWCFHLQTLSAWWLLAPAVLFTATAIYHARILRQQSRAKRAVNFYRRGLTRIEDCWIGTGQQERPIDVSSHLYATDLDLFGPASLFELLSQARTRMGEDTLARWLLAPSPVAEIHQRHAAVVELRTRIDLREDLAVLDQSPGQDPGGLPGEVPGPPPGHRAGGAPERDPLVSAHPEALLAWAESPPRLDRPALRWLALVLAVAAVAAAILWAETGTKTPFFTLLIVEGAITLALRRRTHQVLHATGDALADLRLLSSLLARLEREPFASPPLQALGQRLFSHHIAGSKAIARLATIVDYIHSLDNPILRLLDIPLLYTVQVAYAAEAWRHAHGRAIRLWLDAIGEAEALLSLATYSFEHPGDPFPEFVEGPPCFCAEALGHPLIPAAACVPNTVTIGGKGPGSVPSSGGPGTEARVLLVSGSNMSGKSTLLRAVGINTVLAMAGAPIRCRRLQLTPLQIGASILVNDSLQEGSSRFYAEITRLRHICDLAEQSPPLLFLLDELLQGTNSKDRLAGAEGIVRALLASGAIGIISTHDLALTHIGSDANGPGHPPSAAAHPPKGDSRLRNLHFQDEVHNGRMQFDFKLRDGVATHSNGIELMRMIGLKV